MPVYSRVTRHYLLNSPKSQNGYSTVSVYQNISLKTDFKVASFKWPMYKQEQLGNVLGTMVLETKVFDDVHQLQAGELPKQLQGSS